MSLLSGSPLSSAALTSRPRRRRAPAPLTGVPVRLRDGRSAVLRPLRPGETEPLLEVFDELSPASRLGRYLVGMTRLPSPMVAALADVDGCRHAAWLAEVDGRPAGLARFVRTAPVSAELAFEVADRHHGHGLGTALVDAVTTVAAARGVRRLEATLLPDNHASAHLLRLLGLGLVAVGGLLEATGPLRLLDPARVDRAAVLAVADRHVEWTTATPEAH